MNKTVRTLIITILVASLGVASSGCSKSAKECQDIAYDFIEAALDRDLDDMADLCSDEDDAIDALSMYSDEIPNDAVDAILELAEIKSVKANVSGDECDVTVIIELPDWEAVLDEDPEDMDDFEDYLEDTEDIVEIEVVLELEMNKKDKWEITNPDEFAEDFYEEIFSLQLGFESPLASNVSFARWFYYDYTLDNGTVVYNSYSDCIDLDIGFDSNVDGINDIYYVVLMDGRPVYTSSLGQTMGYYYNSYSGAEGDYIVPAEYTITFYDCNGAVVYSDICIVE